jgi:hypothetical protein
MFKVISISVILFFFLNGYSQQLIIDDPSNLKKGIYRDFNEFKHNSPSIAMNYEITNRTRKSGTLNTGKEVIFYYLVISKQEGKSIGKIYGFCDGANVYVAEGNPKLGPKTGFVMINYLGRYCVYETIEYTSAYTGTTTVTTSKQIERAIDLVNGAVYTLSKNNVRDLIGSDAELSKEFDELKHKNEFLRDYIIKYSEKHRDDLVEPETSFMKDAGNLCFQTENDSTWENYYKRILDFASDPEILNIQLRKEEYGNGALKNIGIMAMHKQAGDQYLFYRIGTWRYYYKNGQLQEYIEYDMNQKKIGIYRKYSEEGELVEEIIYDAR